MKPPTPGRPLIIAKGLTRTYKLGAGEVVGISNIDLRIAQGDFAILKGNSGSGKSTLLAILGGLDQPTSGDLTICDQDMRKATPAQLVQYRREEVGMVFQSFNLLPTLTLLENVCLPGLLAGHPSTKVQKKAFELLHWLNLANRSQHLPAQLSGGEMQRTAIARALINDPRIILADEPTGNLDSMNGQAVIELLRDLNRDNGRTIILATHSNIADCWANVWISLKDGQIVESLCKS